MQRRPVAHATFEQPSPEPAGGEALQRPSRQLCPGAQLTLAKQRLPWLGTGSHLWVTSEQKSAQKGWVLSSPRASV
jgi:hypothetical protein